MRAVRFVMAGLLVAGLVVMAEAQPGGGFGRGFGFGPVQLVQNEAVEKELKMTDDQIEKVKTWGKEFQTKQFENMKGLKDLSKEERTEKLASITAESRKTAYKDLAGILKSEQVTRLKQIELQASGVRAFQQPDVADELKLTDAQKSKIKGIAEEYQKDSRELFGGGGGKGGFGKGGFDKEKFAEITKKREKLEKSAMGDIEDALTADQKKSWKAMTGEPFDRSKLTPLGGGFGGRPRQKQKD